MRRSPSVAPIAALALEAAGLTVAAVWAHGLPTHLCDEGVPRPSAWIYAGILLFGLGVSVVALFLSATLIQDNRILQSSYAGLALAGAIAAILIAFYLEGKYSHYMCG